MQIVINVTVYIIIFNLTDSPAMIAPHPPQRTKEWIANEFLDLNVLEMEKRDGTPSFLDMAR